MEQTNGAVNKLIPDDYDYTIPSSQLWSRRQNASSNNTMLSGACFPFFSSFHQFLFILKHIVWL